MSNTPSRFFANKTKQATPKARLRLEPLESRGKTVRWVEGAKVDIKPSGLIGTQLAELLTKIGTGAVGGENYRVPDGDRERLLDQHGIMHLHLGSSKSNVLLYVVQFEEEVVVLALSDHRYIVEKPISRSSLKTLAENAAVAPAETVAGPEIKAIVVERVRRRPPKP